jgi:hypothetical protein
MIRVGVLNEFIDSFICRVATQEISQILSRNVTVVITIKAIESFSNPFLFNMALPIDEGVRSNRYQ